MRTRLDVKLPSTYQEFIHKSRYSRWLEEEGRRETWSETVYRYLDFMDAHLKKNFHYEMPDDLYNDLAGAILSLKIMPSMRALMTAGPALERNHIAGYNCSYIVVDSPRSFDEAMFVLMCGTGVGFSVEAKYVQKLPTISEEFEFSPTIIKVADSKEGWCSAYKELISMLIQGRIPTWDLSLIRPAGARLKTFGGRASGPAPLDDLFNFTVQVFKDSAGRKLTPIECHDLMCKIGEVVVVGGVRRSAMISLSDLNDDLMRTAKSGAWWEQNKQRSLANNSAVYNQKPPMEIFFKEWMALYESKSGERGIFNREAAKEASGRRDNSYEFGTNPCGEIVLRPNQFCNLTEVVMRHYDNYDSLAEKVRLAAILGTFQSSLTNFKYIRKVWKNNCDEERLLGVSITGILDNSLDLPLDALRAEAQAANEEFAALLGINPSAAITCVKPSGTVSQLVDSASGIHPRYAKYYIRRVRADKKDPLTQMMIDAGIPYEPCVMKPKDTVVFSFPQKSPDHAVTRNELTAIDQLKIWLDYKENWCEHNPSITVYVREHEWLEVGAWVYEHFERICGVSFLPYDNGTYQQAPYEEIGHDQYNELVKAMPEEIDWLALKDYEIEDTTVGTQTFACSGDVCEIVDLTA